MEEWRMVPDYPCYEVSSLGRLRRGERILSLPLSTKGYPRITLSKDGKRCSKEVYKFVAAVFLGPRPPGMQINHKDGNKQNGALENLEYVTPSENVKHGYRTGLHKAPAGEKCGGSKLTEAQVREIFALQGVMPQKEIARRMGVTPLNIQKIMKRETWAHLQVDSSWEKKRDGFCRRGHEMTPENTYAYTKSDGSRYRRCRECHRRSQALWKAPQKHV